MRINELMKKRGLFGSKVVDWLFVLEAMHPLQLVIELLSEALVPERKPRTALEPALKSINSRPITCLSKPSSYCGSRPSPLPAPYRHIVKSRSIARMINWHPAT